MRIFASAAERTVALTFSIVCVQNRNTAEMKRTHCNFAFAAYNLDEVRAFQCYSGFNEQQFFVLKCVVEQSAIQEHFERVARSDT